MLRLRLLLPAFLFLSLSLYQLNLPGLHYDEAFEVVPAMQLLQGGPVHAFRDSTLTLFGRTFPLTTQDYIGALNTYGSLPFLALGGIRVVSLRAYSIFVGLVTLGLVYGFTAEWSRSPGAGLAAAMLLAVNPTFVFWSRQGIFVTALTAAIGVAAAWSWLRWRRTGRYRWALVGAFLFGLGVYAKLLFVWLIVALGGAFLLTADRRPLATARRALATLTAPRPPAPAILLRRGGELLAAVALGCWPLIVYNLQTGGTLKSIGRNAATSYYGVDNTAVLHNLAARMEQFVILLSGGHLWYLGGVYTNPVAPFAFGLALAAAGWLAWRSKRPLPLFPFAVIAFVIAASVVTVSALWVTHFAVLMVWPAIAIAVTGAEVARRLRPSRSARTALLLALALLLATEGWTTVRYHRALTVSGGLSDHSDAIYDMADWLNRNARGPVVAMDWGLAAPITYLTAGRVTPIEVFGYDWGDVTPFERIVRPHLTARRTLFLWRAPEETIFHRSEEFQAMYRPLNLEEDILAAFYERSGRPVLGVTILVPQGTARNRPQ